MSDYEMDFDDEDDFKPMDFDEEDDFKPMDFDDEDDFKPMDFDDEDDVEFKPTDFDDIEPEFQVRPERDVYDRVGMFGTEPTERFYKVAEAIVLDLNEQVSPSPFSDMDIEKIKITPVPFYEFKNPTAYVLGYLGSSKKKGLTKETIKYVFTKILPKVQDKSVKKPDVVRYSKLWESL